MKVFIKIASWLFHPIVIPLAGVILYFLTTPKFFSASLIQAKILALLVLTLCIPFLFLLVLKSTGIVESIHLKKPQERRLPLLFFCVITTLVLQYVFDNFYMVELYYFFAGILFSVLTCFILSWFRVSVSLHLVGISGLCMYIIALSIFYKLNLVSLIAFLCFAIGWTASSRIHTKMHRPLEIIFGFFIGVLPQFILVQYWS